MLLGHQGGQAPGLKPRGRIRAFAIIGSEPAIMLTGPVDVTEEGSERAGMTIADIDLFEVNEAFASVVLRFLQALTSIQTSSTSMAARLRWAIRWARPAR